ncbi:MAG: alpha/beta fold hydrolase [Anaerolineae bacterium]|nr:alpha/beta fold hydrolase [Anaerolineae bacterium]
MSALVLDNGIVHYEYFGRGRPLIFIHGWIGSWRYWVSAMDAVSGANRVYALDLWGYGDSDKSTRQYSIECYVELLRAFVEELGIREPIPLVGHALGAAVAVSYALAYPKQVERVLAVSLPLERGAINRRLLNGGVSLFDRVLGRSPTNGYAVIEEEAGRAAPDAVRDSVESVIHLNLRSRLPALESPVLAVYGENDNVIAPPAAHDLEGNALGSRVHMLCMPEARHFPMLDRSSQFNRLLLDFLQSDDLHAIALKNEWQRRVR